MNLLWNVIDFDGWGGYSWAEVMCGGFRECYWGIWIMKYPEGSWIKTHTDESIGYKLYKFNIIYKQPKEGGEFFIDGAIIDWAWLKVFRADICEHSVTPIVSGERAVLSIGLSIPDPNYKRVK